MQELLNGVDISQLDSNNQACLANYINSNVVDEIPNEKTILIMKRLIDLGASVDATISLKKEKVTIKEYLLSNNELNDEFKSYLTNRCKT